jgi:hypothetical protein
MTPLIDMIDNVRPRLEPDEQLRYVFAGERGLNRGLEALGWVPGFGEAIDWLFLFSNRARIVAITDDRIAVFSAGKLSRKMPKKLLDSIPRSTRIEHGAKRRSKLMIGSEKIRVERRIYGVIDQANAEISEVLPA